MIKFFTFSFRKFMKINIKSNPDTGKTSREIHIRHVDNFYSITPAKDDNETCPETETQATKKLS